MDNMNPLSAQGESVDQETIFGSRIKNPVVMDVRTEGNSIYFNARNNSYFPYILEIKFGDFRNLSPRVFEKKTTLLPGNNRLFTFKIINPEEAPVLGYQTRYYMAKTSEGDRFNPYLVPIGKGKTVEFRISKEEGRNNIYLNQFVMNVGDTVFNSRKGTITALPGKTGDMDRILGNNSLEILHADGTIAAYTGLNTATTHLKQGSEVYPGQPLGIIGNPNELIFQVFEILDEGRIRSIDILYSEKDQKMISSQNLVGIKVIHPDGIVTKEMTKKEKARYEKHDLF